MRTVFEDLRHLLDTVEHWLKLVRTRKPTKAERQLVDALELYIRQCRRDAARGTAEMAARRAIDKINKAWTPLWVRLFSREPR